MRQSLMTSFDQLYFIDLHGNTKKQEKTPEGEPDKNVFDIQQGVAISIMIKKKGLEKKVFHAEYFGKRKQKFEQLLNNSLDTIDFVELKPNTPFYLFIPQNQDNINKYDKFWQLTDVFEKYSLGVFTHRDFFLTDFNSQKLYERIDTFKGLRNKQQIEAEFQLKDTRDWKIDKAIKEIQIEKIKIEKYAYRPFDFRNICYNQCFYDRGTSRYEIMKGFLTPNSNLALNTSRMTQRQSQYCDVLISDKITDAHFCTGGNYVFPLYRYNGNGNNGNQTEFLFKEDDKKDNFTDKFRSFIRTLFTSKSIDQKYIKQVENNIKGLQKQYKQVEKFISSFEKSNVSEEIINLQKQTVEELKTAIEQKQNEIVQSEQNAFLNCIPSPEQILHYIYAILHSPTYRDKYAEFLKIDFPRIPFTKDLEMFGTLAKLGEQLVNAHTQIKVSDNIEFEKKINFLSDGDNIILKPEYFNNKLYINKTQYFEPIPETVYNYYIGGYQVLDKYIKDRKNREISLTDVETIKNIVNVINFTIHKMIEVDKLTNSWI